MNVKLYLKKSVYVVRKRRIATGTKLFFVMLCTRIGLSFVSCELRRSISMVVIQRNTRVKRMSCVIFNGTNFPSCG